MITSHIKNFQISAKSITVDVSARGIIYTLSIFGPDLKTIRSLQMLQKRDMLNGLELIDKFDDGAADHFEHAGTFEVVCCVAGDNRKKQTAMLVLINHDEMIRHPSYTN